MEKLAPEHVTCFGAESQDGGSKVAHLPSNFRRPGMAFVHVVFAQLDEYNVWIDLGNNLQFVIGLAQSQAANAVEDHRHSFGIESQIQPRVVRAEG